MPGGSELYYAITLIVAPPVGGFGEDGVSAEALGWLANNLRKCLSVNLAQPVTFLSYGKSSSSYEFVLHKRFRHLFLDIIFL